MKKTVNLDELQLLKRGNIFKHGLFTLIGFLLINAMVHSCGITWAKEKREELTIILFVVTIIIIECICYDIYPLTENKQKYFINFAGFFGLMMIILCMYDFLYENIDVFVNGMISESALGIVYGMMFLSTCFVYKLKLKYNDNHEHEE